MWDLRVELHPFTYNVNTFEFVFFPSLFNAFWRNCRAGTSPTYIFLEIHFARFSRFLFRYHRFNWECSMITWWSKEDCSSIWKNSTDDERLLIIEILETLVSSTNYTVHVFVLRIRGLIHRDETNANRHDFDQNGAKNNFVAQLVQMSPSSIFGIHLNGLLNSCHLPTIYRE